MPSQKNRVYRERFTQSIVRIIFTEVNLKHPKPRRRIDFTV